MGLCKLLQCVLGAAGPGTDQPRLPDTAVTDNDTFDDVKILSDGIKIGNVFHRSVRLWCLRRGAAAIKMLLPEK